MERQKTYQVRSKKAANDLSIGDAPQKSNRAFKACGCKGKAFNTKSFWHACQKRREQDKSITEQDGIGLRAWTKR